MKQWITMILIMSLLTACEQADLSPNGGRASIQKAGYSVDKAIQQGEVVNLHGKVSNLDRWDGFLDNVQNKKAGKVRITQITVEGDPIFYDLVYDGQVIKYQYDNSMDAFAGQDKGKSGTTCQGIEKKQDPKGTIYTLKGCSSSVGNTFGFLVQGS